MRYMTSLFILSVLLSSPAAAQDVWTVQKPHPGLDRDINDLHIFDAATAIVVGDSGTVLETSDSGQTWTQQASGLADTVDLTAVFFLDNSTGWAAGTAGTIIKTSDGGHSWTALSSGSGETFYSLFFTSADTGWVGGAETLARTTDGGATWSTVMRTADFSSRFLDGRFAVLHFTDSKTGMVAGFVKETDLGPEPYIFRKILRRTTDGGSTWTAPSLIEQQQGCGFMVESITDVAFIDADTGWMVGQNLEFNAWLVAKTSDGGATWNQISCPEMTARTVFFWDENNGLIAGDDGDMARSSDGGTKDSWQKMPAWTSERVQKVRFADSAHGWAVGWRGTILRSDDGGQSWAPQYNTTYDFQTAYFLDEQTGWVAGGVGPRSGVILKTEDGGTTWQTQMLSRWPTIRALYFHDANTGWAAGGDVNYRDGSSENVILKTSDGGASWQPQTPGVTTVLNGLSFIDADSGWVVGSDIFTGRAILQTTDGGASWTPLSYAGDSPATLTAVHFVDGSRGFISGYGGTTTRYAVLRTDDGGATWTPQMNDANIQIMDVQFLDRNTGFAVGEATGGTHRNVFMRTNNGGESWMIQYDLGSDPVQPLYDVHFLDPEHGWATGANGAVLQFVSGVFHVSQYDTPAKTLRAGSFISPAEGWAAGDDGWILKLYSEPRQFQVWSDDFEDGNADGWQPLTPARWQIAEEGGYHSYHLNSTDYQPAVDGRLGEYSLVKDRIYENFELRCDIKSAEDFAANAYADFAVVFAFRDSLNYDYILFNTNAAASSFNKVVNGVRQKIQELDGFVIPDNEYHAYRISRQQNQVRVYLPDGREIQMQDDNPTPGFVGIGSVNDAAFFDSFTIEGQILDLSVDLELPPATVQYGDTLQTVVRARSDNAISYAQLVLEYDSTLLQFIDAAPGADAASLSLLVNSSLPFQPSTAGFDANVLLQLSGSGSFSGPDQDILVIRWLALLEADTSTTLALDKDPARTQFSTLHGFDITGDAVSFTAGALTIETEKYPISGAVSYLQSGVPVPGTLIELRHLTGTSLDTSGSDGHFDFPAVRADSVWLQPRKSDDTRTGISGADAVLSLRTLAFLDTLSGNQLLTADVNENGRLSGSDAVALLRYLAFLPVSVGSPGHWRFDPPDSAFVLSEPAQVDFTARLLGDVNLDWKAEPATLQAAKAQRSPVRAGIAEIRLADFTVAAGDTFALPVWVQADSALSFLQFALGYDAAVLELLSVEAGPGAAGMDVLVNDEPPFAPEGAQQGKGLVVQLASASAQIAGQAQVAVLHMRAAGAAGAETGLTFYREPERTSVTTVNYLDAASPELVLRDGTVRIDVASSVAAGPGSIPKQYRLLQNFPNPFAVSGQAMAKTGTVIAFQVPQPGLVEIRIYNLQGQVVRTLLSSEKTAGAFEAYWDGRDTKGRLLPAGYYFYQMRAGNFSASKRMLLLR